MKKTFFRKAIFILLVTASLMALTSCLAPQEDKEKKTPGDDKLTKQDLSYDYDLIYAYLNAEYKEDEVLKLAGLLQSKDTLEVEGINYRDDDGVLQISCRLNLTEANPEYKVNFTKQMQDAIVLFAVFNYIESVEFNFKQADYTFRGAPIMKKDAEDIFKGEIAPLVNTKEDFKLKFAPKVEAVVWERNGMDTINYRHVMGLD